jgi:hypothetical protein
MDCFSFCGRELDGTLDGVPRAKRIALGGYVYHVLNRANGPLRIFHKPGELNAARPAAGPAWIAFTQGHQVTKNNIVRVGIPLCRLPALCEIKSPQ